MGVRHSAQEANGCSSKNSFGKNPQLSVSINRSKRMDGCAHHLSEYFILLVSNAHQLLNKAIWKVPTQHVRYQQRLLKRAPKSSKHTANK